jgi:hypothetical protein
MGAGQLPGRRPDLVIVSLWRSCIVALLAKLAMPRLRLVAFLYLAAPMHLPDRLLNAAALRSFPHGRLGSRKLSDGLDAGHDIFGRDHHEQIRIWRWHRAS